MDTPRIPSRRFLLVGALLWVTALGACGEDGSTAPDPALAPFVGVWDARRFVVKSRANPEIAPDLIGDLNSDFSVDVQPSGQYTAILVFQQTPITEFGTLEVDGDEVVFNVTSPGTRTDRSRFTFEGTQRVTLVGETEFDYNFDGTPEPAEATIELIRR